MNAYAVLLEHLDVANVFVGSLVDVEVVFKQSCRWMDNAIEQLLTRGVHQYVARLAPLGLRIYHFLRNLRLNRCANDGEHGYKGASYIPFHS